MKRILSSLLFILVSTHAFAKIVISEDKLYLRKGGDSIPLVFVNDLIEKKLVSEVKLFGKGDIHLISFAKNGEKEKIYSVDEKGYVYSIEPFASYSIKDINKKGLVEFKQAPGKRYRINSKGIFVY